MILDLVAALLIAAGFYFGYQRGLIKTVFDTASIFIGIIAALKLSPITIGFLNKSLNLGPSIGFILGVVITFILVMVLIRFVGKKLEALLSAVNLNFINKLNGGALQALFFALILGYAVSLLDKINVIKDETKTASMSYPYLTKMPELSSSLLVKLKPMFSEFWSATNKAMDDIKNKAESSDLE